MGMKSLSDPSGGLFCTHVEAAGRYTCRCTGLAELAVEKVASSVKNMKPQHVWVALVQFWHRGWICSRRFRRIMTAPLESGYTSTCLES